MSTLSTLRRFGSGTQIYDIPATVTKWRDNFATLMTMSDQLPGLDGGFDNYGFGVSPSAVGTVEATFWLVVTNDQEAQMTTMKDALLTIAGWGKQTLWLQPYDKTKQERWCNARIKSIDMPEDAASCTNTQQEVHVVWEVPEARWYALPAGSSPYVWGGSTSIWNDSALVWGGGAGSPYTGPGPTSFQISSGGSAASPPLVKLTCDATHIMTNPIITRLVNGNVVESVKFNGTIGNNQVLIIDAQRLSAKLNSTDVYDVLDLLTSSWLTVKPGVNTFQISSDLGTDQCAVKIIFNEAYY